MNSGQQTIFDQDLGRNHRRSDPITAKAAASEIAPKLGKLRKKVLGYVCRYPYMTALELGAKWANGDPYKLMQVTRTFGRRLPELVALGLAGEMIGSPCNFSGHVTKRYYPTPLGVAENGDSGHVE